jgi:predicted YcjX-like family ATPase
MAAGNVTYLIRQPGRAVLPSNFIGLPMMSYYPKSTDWPGGQVKQLAVYFERSLKGDNTLIADS